MDYESEGLVQTRHCTPVHSDICVREPKLASTYDNAGTPGRIQQTTLTAANYDGNFNLTSKTDPGQLLVSEVRPLLPSSRAHSDLSNETYPVESWNSLVDDQAEASLGSSGYLETYKTRTKTYFEYVESHAANNISNPKETHNTGNNTSVNGRERSSELLQSGDLIPTNTRGLNTGDVDLMNTTQSSRKANAECLCPPKVLTVSFTPLSYDPEWASSQGESSRTERCRDCYVTMPKVREGYVMATSVKKTIGLTTSDFAGTEVPFNFEVRATTTLCCCLRRGLNNKQVRIELQGIGGVVDVAESSRADTPVLVLKAVRTNLEASLNNHENSIGNLQGPEGHKVLKSFCPCNNKGQIQPEEDLLWLDFSDVEPFHDEVAGSRTLELGCDMINRLLMDKKESSRKALSLNHNEKVHFEGQIYGDLDPNSFVEINLRYQVEISYLEDFSSRLVRDSRCQTCTRVPKKIDFDCVL